MIYSTWCEKMGLKTLFGIFIIFLLFSGCVNTYPTGTVGKAEMLKEEAIQAEPRLGSVEDLDYDNDTEDDKFAPTVPLVKISPSDYAEENDDLVCTASGSNDADGTSVEYIYYWEKNETEQEQFANRKTIS